jgi:glycerol-3-phosphate dehydrogenase
MRRGKRREPTLIRSDAVQSLAQADGSFDVVVIGGGIVGAGTAALAARLGLRTALLERADFASGTSSASSKLVHGGLRYLRMGDVGLVREALYEARVLRDRVAPHLVHERRFVLPVYDDGPYGRLAIRAAMTGYGALAFRRNSVVSAARARQLVPHLRADGLRAAGVYRDAQTNDARLVLANVRAAADAGAFVVNRCEVVGLERGIVHTSTGLELRARHVVNATGAAVDAVRRLEDQRAGTSVALSKGVHLVLDLPPDWNIALTVPVDAMRVAFAVPWEGMLLLGTTDTPAETAEVTDEDEAQILDEAARALPPQLLARDAVRARFAGLRVLPMTTQSTAKARREVTLTRGALDMVSVAGGKLTTYRVIARAVLRELGYDVRGTAVPLPGAADPSRVAAELPVEPTLARHLAHTYGSLAHEVLATSDDLDQLAPGAPEVGAQVVYAREREWAVDAEDFLRRRTTLALRGLATPALRNRVEALLAGRDVAAR